VGIGATGGAVTRVIDVVNAVAAVWVRRRESGVQGPSDCARGGGRFPWAVSSAFQDDAESCSAGTEVVDCFVDLVEGVGLADGCDVMAGCEVEHVECGGRAA
jgi:hypothetical protein